MPSAGFKPTVPATEQLQIHTLDGMTTEIR